MHWHPLGETVWIKLEKVHVHIACFSMLCITAGRHASGEIQPDCDHQKQQANNDGTMNNDGKTG